MTYRHTNIRNLTYSEFLATIPWVLLRPNYVQIDEQCQHTRRGRPAKNPCKVTPQLIYLHADGTMSYWCHHHLHDLLDENWWGDDVEVKRVQDWWKRHYRAAYTEKKMPLEDVDYLRHLKVDEAKCDVDPNDLDRDEAGLP